MIFEITENKKFIKIDLLSEDFDNSRKLFLEDADLQYYDGLDATKIEIEYKEFISKIISLALEEAIEYKDKINGIYDPEDNEDELGEAYDCLNYSVILSSMLYERGLIKEKYIYIPISEVGLTSNDTIGKNLNVLNYIDSIIRVQNEFPYRRLYSLVRDDEVARSKKLLDYILVKDLLPKTIGSAIDLVLQSSDYSSVEDIIKVLNESSTKLK